MAIHRCNKERQIDDMEAKINELDRVIHKDANGDSLVSMVKQSVANQKQMDDKLWMVDSNIIGLMKFQTKVETERGIKLEIQDRRTKRQQWLISLLIGAVIGLGGLIIALITL